MNMKPDLLIANLRKTVANGVIKIRSGPNLFSFALCVFAAIVIIAGGNQQSINDISNYEAGKVADRDITAAIAVSFRDEEATRQRLQAALRHVHAVFWFSDEVNINMIDSWNAFCDFADIDRAQALIAIESRYPGYFSDETLEIYLSSANRASFREYGLEALNAIMNQGVYTYHRDEIRQYDQETAELIRISETGSVREIVYYDDIITTTGTRSALREIVRNSDAPVQFKIIAEDLLRPFIRENVFFSYSESAKNMEETMERTPPVIRNIEPGKKIIRKGFIITEAEMEDLQALYLSSPGRDPRNTAGLIFLVLLVFILFIILLGKIILGRELSKNERYLLASLVGSYIIGAVLLNNFFPALEGFPVSLAIPTALFIMIISVFMGTRPAMIIALALPLGAYFAGAFDNSSYIIALVSGAAASTVLHNAQKRMSLIKAGLIIAVANCFAVIVVLLLKQSNFYFYPVLLFWAALNGIISGMLTLGFLPPLEYALNAVTPFRLMELSDLNAPLLRKLFTVAPGTHSHSLMVATLAEQACQDIGANALLARVGAYYHDIGKMENPDYFVENQTDHNRHDEISPRLSATVIRSHVKLGVEKAHSLGLPKDVINIISEHHGNSVITWFYNKAMEQEEIVSVEDFIYPGSPPRTRESAVVMLADMTEAAVRTLNKPTAAKIDKFIQQLFDAKVDHGQLSDSDLSFRELEMIKKAFVKVLAGYYHSRIEYPNQKEEE
ncbi:MAG: HDIG domain-containing protein [Treponema sp.]|jgi:putative nucleotidyltransferase with HDIG domain|nr:HDIG domain-containing protein [Treponema sp.]